MKPGLEVVGKIVTITVGTVVGVGVIIGSDVEVGCGTIVLVAAGFRVGATG